MLHHREHPTGGVDTAVLLCTERRWNRCTTKLIVDICATGVLGDDALADRGPSTIRDHPPSRRCCAGPQDVCYAASGPPSTG